MDYDTGCRLPLLLQAAALLPALIGHDIPSQLAKAGQRLDLHAPPADFPTWRDRALARDTVVRSDA
jgi:hydroxymethylglutaryl-CoA lyase